MTALIFGGKGPRLHFLFGVNSVQLNFLFPKVSLAGKMPEKPENRKSLVTLQETNRVCVCVHTFV